MHVAYDIETFPNVFTCAMEAIQDDRAWVYEVSARRCDGAHLAYDLRNGSLTRMIGYNNLSFDYPILHLLLRLVDAGYYGPALAAGLYQKCVEIIASENQWEHRVRPWEVAVQQVDLMLVHHFDNPVKRTSLKTLEFNMASPYVEEMPFKPGTVLMPDQIDTLISYNLNDVRETKRFARLSADAIKFREDLIDRGWFGVEVLNYNDTKIGKEYFISRLERHRPGITAGKPGTYRPHIALADCILPYVRFDRPELRDLLDKLRAICFAGTNTRAAYKERVILDGLPIDIGQGGIHGSVERRTVTASDGYIIADIDVTGYYPSLSIVNNIYPQHLGPLFCEVYREIRDAREIAKAEGRKVEAGTLKLATNGTFGDFGNIHSKAFYDPQCLISVTINGQLLQLMLVEQLMRIPSLEVIQMNTDGLTVRLHGGGVSDLEAMCKWWETMTILRLERKEYAAMWVRDVNNYLALEAPASQAVRGGWEKHKGSVKRKGAYDWEMLSGSTGGQLAWNRDFSHLVVPKAAEAAFIHDQDVTDFIDNHTAAYDFAIRARVTGGARLQLADGTPLPSTVRYYIAHGGQPLVKIMPPLKGQLAERRIGIHAEGQAACSGKRGEWRCNMCGASFPTKAVFEAHNRERHAWGIAVKNRWDGDLSGIDRRFYVQEAERLLF